MPGRLAFRKTMIGEHSAMVSEGGSKMLSKSADARGSSRGWFVILLALAITAGVLGAVLFRRTETSRTGTNQVLHIAPELLDLGHLWDNTRFPWTLHLRNETAEEIEVVEIKNSCNCVSVEPKSFVVPGGGSTAVELLLDLHSKDPDDASRPWWSYETELVAITKTHLPEENLWGLRGRVYRYPLIALPAPVDFAELLVAAYAFPSMTVDVECLRPTADLSARCDESMAAVRVKRVEETPQRYRLEISPREDLPAGEHRFSVHLRPKIAANHVPPGLEDIPELELPVIANVCRDVYVSPSHIAFGAVTVDEVAEQIVMLSSRHRKPFSVQVAESGTSSVAPVTVDSGGDSLDCCFRVSQQATESGPQSTEVRFTVEQQGGKASYEIVLPVSYHGIMK